MTNARAGLEYRLDYHPSDKVFDRIAVARHTLCLVVVSNLDDRRSNARSDRLSCSACPSTPPHKTKIPLRHWSGWQTFFTLAGVRPNQSRKGTSRVCHLCHLHAGCQANDGPCFFSHALRLYSNPGDLSTGFQFNQSW